MESKSPWSRRSFLRSASGILPTLELLQEEAAASPEPEETEAPGKFTAIDLERYFTAAPSDFGSREPAKNLRGAAQDGLIRTPSGKQVFRGIPFSLGPEGVNAKSWIVLSKHSTGWTAANVEIPMQGKANFVCLAQFCDWDENESPPDGRDVIERVGQPLGEVTLVHEEGIEQTLPIRRRFEVNAPWVFWGHMSFVCKPHTQDAPSKLTDSLPNAMYWGNLQWTVRDNSYPVGPDGRPPVLWLCALPIAAPTKTLKAVRFRALSEDPLCICGLTLFHGNDNPLRYERLRLYRLTLPEAAADQKGRWQVTTDLGIVGRSYVLGSFDPQAWLSSPRVGLGEQAPPTAGARHLYVEMTASSDATLVLRDNKTGSRYEFDLRDAVPGREIEARAPGARIEFLEQHKTWVHGRVLDKTTGAPTPVRLSIRNKDGRYIPPYGHRTEVNDGWFQDYGADLKLMDSSFAYIDGDFQVELPVGDVYVEISKGFEYEAIRKKIAIQPGQRELSLELPRFANLRAAGWVTADTHVHFLSPSTAVLEGQAEGLNLINLLAAQWGDLYTNVGDLWQGALSSNDRETLVVMGTENRQHILGHMGLLGGHGEPVYPMSAAGPGEGYLGEPVWTSMAEWADTSRKRDGLVISAHFPVPMGEIAADVILGKIDAVEMQPIGMSHHFNGLRFLDWYRYLNCGYRLPAVSGTDKMAAYMPVGATRTYAYLGNRELNFTNWMKAVRAGNTFMSSGPLLLFDVDGHPPGQEIHVGPGGGSLEIRAEVKSFYPVQRLEVVQNGKVVASREDAKGSRELTLKETIRVTGSCWLAARCASNAGPVTIWSVNISAHTSPVYVTVPATKLFSESAAAYMLTLLDGGQAWLENLATRPDPDRFQQILSVFSKARAELHRRLHEQGVAHSHPHRSSRLRA